VNFHNLLKAGLELVTGDLNFDYGEEKEVYVEGNTYVRMHKFPVRGGLYVQNKLEIEGLIVNAGLRLDYNNANTDWPAVDAWNKSFYSSNYIEGTSYALEGSKNQLSLSPRLGISHPITESSKLYFNYGHFKQLPTYEQMFRLSRGGSNEVRGIGDPNLILEKTIAYELGYDQSLFETYLIQAAAFYHDIVNQRDYTRYQSADGSMNYYLATNNSYEDVQGFELTFRKPIGQWWSALLNYTYQVSTRGHFGKSEIYQDPNAQREYDRNTRILYQERPIPRPYARAKVSFFTPPGFGPRFLGIPFLSDWNLNVIADWQAGAWMTWNPSEKLNVSQNVRAKDWYNVQLRLSKQFAIPRGNILFFIDMENALNTRRLSLNSFYDGFDHDYYFQSLHLPRSGDYSNIVGEDRIGDVREKGIAFQPIEQVGNVAALPSSSIDPDVIYYETSSGRYMNYTSGAWSEVESGRMQRILDDKAYIDMPNHTYFNFLNPRRIFFCIKVTFDLR
jgi:outer membrane receptor protein involved in Fe transport